jgi:hypothetical protein
MAAPLFLIAWYHPGFLQAEYVSHPAEPYLTRLPGPWNGRKAEPHHEGVMCHLEVGLLWRSRQHKGRKKQ